MVGFAAPRQSCDRKATCQANEAKLRQCERDKAELERQLEDAEARYAESQRAIKELQAKTAETRYVQTEVESLEAKALRIAMERELDMHTGDAKKFALALVERIQATAKQITHGWQVQAKSGGKSAWKND